VKKLLLKSTVSFSFITLFLFVFPKLAHAQLVINEFSSYTSDDWIELVNIGNADVDLSNYAIRDLTQNNKVSLSGILKPDGIKDFSFSDSLNKNGDVIKIIRLEAGAEVETIYYLCYGDEANNSLCSNPNSIRISCVSDDSAPTSSIGSYPSDGGNTFDRLSPTRGGTNSTATLNPCPTPTPVPTNSPTNIPTNSPTITPTPTPKPSNTQTPTATKKPTNSPTEPEESPAEGDELVLGLSDSFLSQTPTPPEVSEGGGSGNSFPFIPVLFIILGVGFIACAVFLVIKERKKDLTFDNVKNITRQDN